VKLDKENKVYEDVHNYTKYKLVEMLINRLNDGRLNLDNLNAIEDVADDVLRTLAICGLKYHQELKGQFGKDK
tara:strand:+ start:73 stop:291 length:219 start_codon:yes stop_codon:yes gene_type:complete